MTTIDFLIHYHNRLLKHSTDMDSISYHSLILYELKLLKRSEEILYHFDNQIDNQNKGETFQYTKYQSLTVPDVDKLND